MKCLNISVKTFFFKINRTQKNQDPEFTYCLMYIPQAHLFLLPLPINRFVEYKHLPAIDFIYFFLLQIQATSKPK